MQITPHPATIEKIFTGVDTSYQVPHYQRDYAWTLDNISELWLDVVAAWEGGSEYFVGAIVLNEENRSTSSSWEIVDGQQRLASITILLSVVRDIAKAYKDDPRHPAFDALDKTHSGNADKALRAFKKSESLIVHTAEPDNYYLKLNDKDHPVFFDKVQKPGLALLEKHDRRINKTDARVLKAKKHLSACIVEKFLCERDGFVRLDAFLTFCITKLVFLRIDVKSDNDAYLLFETLNDRGLDLSIADLVKNRLLLTCGGDISKRERVYNKWESIATSLKNSRYQPQDFLRFYWIAFHGNTTKREIYAKIKRYLADVSDVETLVDEWREDAAFFARITSKEFTYPPGSISYRMGSDDQAYAEINSLRYSICYPLLIYLNRKKPALLTQVLPVIVSFMFRLISVAGFAGSRAEKACLEALKEARSTSSVSKILSHFRDSEITDERFRKRLAENAIEENDIPRYLLAKLHEHGGGVGLRLTRDAHLEHVLPVDPKKWLRFDTKGKALEEWIYSIGNMTLLEKQLNSSIQNDVFSKKIRSFGRQKGRKPSPNTTAIPMTYEIAEIHRTTGRTWSAEWIKERAQRFAKEACDVWPDPNSASSRPPRAPSRRRTGVRKSRASVK
jgi:uncharacterized protein with ParB-like and HNH nuclease domain